jgi:hypothetical protein
LSCVDLGRVFRADDGLSDTKATMGVNRRVGVPVPIGALSYWSTWRGGGYSWTPIYSTGIELAVDAMELAEHVDQIVLFSGDGDFRSLVEAVQRRGVRVTVVSTISSQPPMIADELRRQADVFTDLVELRSKLSRDLSERPAPRAPVEDLPGFTRK